MRLFRKAVNTFIQTDKLAFYANDVIISLDSLHVRINKLKEVIDQLSKTRKISQAKEREELSEHIFRLLKYVDYKYNEYLLDLHDLKTYNETLKDIKISKDVTKKVIVALNSKKELRKEFETIYINFKNMARKLDNVNMNKILSRMREVFQFDIKEEKTEASKIESVRATYPSW